MGDEPPATARTTLQTLAHRLRRRLVLDVLQTGSTGYLPLALRIAAASLAGRRSSLASYVTRLRDHGLDGLALADDSAAVRTTFDLSYAALAGDA